MLKVRNGWIGSYNVIMGKVFKKGFPIVDYGL